MEINNLSFRLGIAGDLDRLSKINSFGNEEWRIEAKRELPYFIHDHRLLCALVGDEIIGLLYWRESFMRNHQWYLTQITINEDWRRKGIGEALLKKFLSIAKEKNVKEVIADVRTSNHPPRNLMKKLHADEIGSIDFDNDGDPRLLYRINV